MKKIVKKTAQKPELNVKNLEHVVFGKLCINCGFNELHLLYDCRYLCARCSAKINPRQIEAWLKILHCFALGLPMSRTAKDLGYSYNKVKNIYYQVQMAIQNLQKDGFENLSEKLSIEIHTVSKQKLIFEKPMYILIIYDNSAGRIRGKLFWKRNNIFTYLFPDRLTSGINLQTSSVKLKKSLISVCPKITVKKVRKFDCRIKEFVNCLTEKLSVLHGVTNENLQLYISELEFRINHPEEQIFHELIDLTFSPIINQK